VSNLLQSKDIYHQILPNGPLSLRIKDMVKPDIENISVIINKLDELKGQKEELGRTEFLTPVQGEIFKARTDIKWYIWKLTEKERREHFYNHNIAIQYIRAEKGRFVVTDEKELKLYSEDKPGVPKYSGERMDLDEELLVDCLKDKLKRARQEYWQKNIQPLIKEVDKLLFPHWNYLTLYGSWSLEEKIRIEAAIKSKVPADLDEVICELDKIRYRVNIEAEQSAPPNPADTKRNKKKTTKKITTKAKKAGEKGESDKYALIASLMKLHKIGTNKPNLTPLSQKELMADLLWNQPKVHRVMKAIFGPDPMKEYKRCFATGKLTGYMKKLKDGSYEVDGIAEPSDQ